MLIIADENIPGVFEAFSSFGEVRVLHGRHMTADDVHDADVLLVRSITKVDESLLSGSAVKFVGSATIGTDHVDLDWLQSQGIEFANAPACNAISAAEYVMSALLAVAQDKSIDLAGKTVGIIGCGNVGSRVKVRMEAIGIECLICDPPRAESEGQSGFSSMEEVAQADIISVHVPLVKEGKYATRGLINQAFIESLNPDCIFINTSRGDVVDEMTLKSRLDQHKSFTAILDVWNGEPNIDTDLVEKTVFATAHIAGYSIDGKLRATSMLYHALCKANGEKSVWDVDALLPKPELPVISISPGISTVQAITQCIHHVYDIHKDDTALRGTMGLDKADRGKAFDQLRKEYAPRRECAAYRIDEKTMDSEYTSALSAFGFKQIG